MHTHYHSCLCFQSIKTNLMCMCIKNFQFISTIQKQKMFKHNFNETSLKQFRVVDKMQIKLISNHVRNECLSNGIQSWIFSSTSIYNSRQRKIILNGMFKENSHNLRNFNIQSMQGFKNKKKIICQTVQLFISTSLQQLFLIGSKKF